MLKIDLMPCPFCGGKAETFPLDKYDSYGHHERLWYSECGECFARSDYYNTEGEAAIAWNTRASDWISCSERMPEVGEPVLIYELYNDEMVVVSLNCDKMGFSNDDYWYGLRNVPFWMALPEKPKGV